MSLVGTIKAAISLTLIGNADLGMQKATLPFANEIVISSGTGSGQGDLAFFDNRTLAASTSEELDLAGGLSDSFGVTLTFVEVVAIYIKAAAGNGGNIAIGGAAANAFLGPFADATDIINLAAGESFVITNMATGWPVTAATADLLKILNDDSGAAGSYDVTIIGRSA